MVRNGKSCNHITPRHAAFLLLVIILTFNITACTSTPESTSTVVDYDTIQSLVSVSGKLVPETWAMISSTTGGTIKSILVDAGDIVQAGDVLVQLEDADARIALLQANAALESAQANQARIQLGARDEEIALAQAQVLAARSTVSQTISQKEQLLGGQHQANLAAAEAHIRAMQEVQFNANLIHDDTMKCVDVEQADGSTKKVCPALGRLEEQARYALSTANYQLEAAEAQRDALYTTYYKQLLAADAAIGVAESQLYIAEQQLALTLVPVQMEDIAIAEASVKQAEVQVAAAEQVLSRTQLVAPLAGTVVDIDQRPGENLLAGVPLITIGDLDKLYIETTDLDEIDIARVQTGQQVVVTFEALPDITFFGTLTDIALINSDAGSGVSYTAHVTLDEVDPRLRWGMTAFIDITVDN